jgi:hypothetical protein
VKIVRTRLCHLTRHDPRGFEPRRWPGRYPSTALAMEYPVRTRPFVMVPADRKRLGLREVQMAERTSEVCGWPR